MKPLWAQTLAWIAAVLVAVLLAFANPDGMGLSVGDGLSTHGAHGAVAPR
jgi:hypothetical protein